MAERRSGAIASKKPWDKPCDDIRAQYNNNIAREENTTDFYSCLKIYKEKQPSVLCMFSPCAAAFHRIMHNREWNFVSTISPPYLTLLLSSL